MSEKTPAVTIRDARPMDRVQLRPLVLPQPSPFVAIRLKIFQPTRSYLRRWGLTLQKSPRASSQLR
jgi:hypothetical protein